MKLNNSLRYLSNSNFQKFLIFTFFISFFAIGLYIYRDYGMSNDEPFQRSVGYYWLIRILEIFSSDPEIIFEIKKKFQAMYWSNFLNEGNLIQYGILFDTFAAIFEELLNISDNREAFLFKHFLTFCFFFLSSIFFYKIIFERFDNKFFSIVITSFYISSPRLFAESFYNCKDIIFMAFCVYSLYFVLRSFDNLNYKNIFLFSIFSAFATNIRVMGIIILLLFLVFFLFDCLEEKKFFKTNIPKFIFLIFSFCTFLYIFWPFLWEAPFENFLFTIKSFANFNWSGNGILYLGEFYKANNLPWHYIPVWILATSPIILILFFLVGFFSTGTYFFNNFLNLSNKNKLWNGSKQKKDFFVFLFFLIPIFSVIFFNSTLYGGWRHLYFIYPCLIYLSGIGIMFFLQNKFFLKYKNVVFVLIFLLLLNNIYNLKRLHPFQNIYFNSLFEKKANQLFEVDYWGLGNMNALNFLIKERYKGEKIEVKISSYTPLIYSKLILKDEHKNKLASMITTDKKQKFIFTNYVFERNPNYEKKYSVPNNYDKIYTLKKGNVIINEIFEKK